MKPDCRRWTEAMADRWSRRAEQLLEHPDATSAELTRAEMLLSIVSDLRRRLAAPTVQPSAPAAVSRHIGPLAPHSSFPPPDQLSPEQIADLEDRLAKSRPYLHPEYRIMFNDGPILAAVRNSILAILGRPPEPFDIPLVERWRLAPQTAPDKDPEPFVFTVQVDMFGMGAAA